MKNHENIWKNMKIIKIWKTKKKLTIIKQIRKIKKHYEQLRKICKIKKTYGTLWTIMNNYEKIWKLDNY